MTDNVVKVVIWGNTVGYVYWDKRSKCAIFEYDKTFINSVLNISPLNMPIDSMRSKKGLPWYGNTEKLYQGLPPMLADSLPDKWGNSIFNAWIRNNNIKSSSITPVDKLSFIGSRAMGALEYEPARQLEGNASFNVDVESLYKFARQVLTEKEAIDISSETSLLWQDLIKVGGSPGGKRPKILIAIHDENGSIRSGQTTAGEGFTHYMLKYDDESNFPYTKIEYIYYQMAIAAGIEMMPSCIQTFGSMCNFITKRFDRIGDAKIHTQTLAAMNPFADNYDDLFAIIRQLNLPYKDSEQQFLRMVFNVLSRNVDDHSKNFSFCMDQEGKWYLSPAYDITYTIDHSAPNYINNQSFLVNGKDDDITMQDLLEVAKRNDISEAKVLIEKVQESLSRFRLLAQELEVPIQIVNQIEKDISL